MDNKNAFGTRLRELRESRGLDREDVAAATKQAPETIARYERGWPHQIIERQLAHAEKNQVVAAYNHAEWLDQRREMMQWWADWLEDQEGKTS